MVAEHPRVWARGLTITDTAHVAAAARLRQRRNSLRGVASGVFARHSAGGMVHDYPEFERVVEEREHYVVVEKFGEAARVVAKLDPRSRTT